MQSFPEFTDEPWPEPPPTWWRLNLFTPSIDSSLPCVDHPLPPWTRAHSLRTRAHFSISIGIILVWCISKQNTKKKLIYDNLLVQFRPHLSNNHNPIPSCFAVAKISQKVFQNRISKLENLISLDLICGEEEELRSSTLLECNPFTVSIVFLFLLLDISDGGSSVGTGFLS